MRNEEAFTKNSRYKWKGGFNMKCRYALSIAIISVLLLATSLVFAEPTKAEPNNPTHLYLLQETKIYNSRSMTAKSAARLTKHQVVTVVETYVDPKSKRVQWYKVKTWIGNKWIKAEAYQKVSENTYKFDFTLLPGTYKKENLNITSVYPLNLYNYPAESGVGEPKQIQPQKLHVMASIKQDPINWDNLSDIESQSGTWYQINTSNGKKWIYNPDFLEQVVEKPVSYTVILTGKEKFYPHPFPVDTTSLSFENKEVEVVAEWVNGIRANQRTWLKVRLPQGDYWYTEDV